MTNIDACIMYDDSYLSLSLSFTESMEEAMARFPCPSLTKSKSSSGSLFSRAINSLISIDAADEGARLEEAKRDESFEAAARRTADLCHIEDLIADSKFLVRLTI